MGKDETKFTVCLSDDGRHGTICRVPRPIIEFLGSPKSIIFTISGKKIEIMPVDI